MTDPDVNDNEQTTTFRTYDDGLRVRSMTSRDAAIVQRWFMGMGDISKYDLDITLSVFPPGRGFYIGEYDGRVVSSAIRIPWSDTVFYGSYYYVHKDYRKRGFGTRVRDEVAFEYVGDNMLAVDAVLDVVEVNKKKFRYVEAFKTRRFKGVVPSSNPSPDDNGEDTDIVTVDDVSFDALIEYDNQCFVTADNPVRRRFLRRWTAIPDGATYVARTAAGQIVGFGCRRPCIGSLTHIVGPLYAESPRTAHRLLWALCAGISGQHVILECWEPNKAAYALAAKFNLAVEFDCQRMHVNGNPHEFKSSVYSVTSIDVCGF